MDLSWLIYDLCVSMFVVLLRHLVSCLTLVKVIELSCMRKSFQTRCCLLFSPFRQFFTLTLISVLTSVNWASVYTLIYKFLRLNKPYRYQQPDPSQLAHKKHNWKSRIQHTNVIQHFFCVEPNVKWMLTKQSYSKTHWNSKRKPMTEILKC